MSAQRSIECPECHREIAMAQVGNHMRAMHPKVQALRPVADPSADDDGLVFEDPPLTRGGGLHARLAPVVAKLKKHPGRWARLWDYNGRTSASTQVKKARELFPDVEWKAAHRGDGSALYARTQDRDR